MVLAKNISLFFALLLLNILAYSQEYSFVQLKPKVHLLPLINPDRYFLQGSIEVLFKNRMGLEIGYGRRIPKFSTGGIVKPFGESMMVEINYYPKAIKSGKNVRIRMIYGLSVKKIIDCQNKNITWTIQSDNSLNQQIIENVGVNKSMLIFGIKSGIEFYFFKTFGLDLFVEPGLKYKDNSLQSVYYTQPGVSQQNQSIDMLDWKPDRGYYPNLNIGVRLFWLLNMKDFVKK